MLDPNIPLAARAPEFQTPLESQTERTKSQDILLQHQERVRSLQTQAKLRQILQQTGGDLEAALPQIMQLDPETGLTVQTKLNATKRLKLESDTADLEHRRKKLELEGQIFGGVDNNDDYQHALYTAKALGQDVTQYPPQYDPAFIANKKRMAVTDRKRILDDLKARDDEIKALRAGKSPNLVSVAPGHSLVDPETRQAVYTAPGKPETDAKAGSFEDYVTRYAASKNKPLDQLTTADIEEARKRYNQADDRPRVNVTVAGQGADDVKLAVQ